MLFLLVPASLLTLAAATDPLLRGYCVVLMGVLFVLGLAAIVPDLEQMEE
jgi:hypothetical protein